MTVPARLTPDGPSNDESLELISTWPTTREDDTCGEYK